MYVTAKEAREVAARFVGKYDIPPVIMERKLTKDARKSFFGFRFFGNEEFKPGWYKEDDHSYARMIEILQ